MEKEEDKKERKSQKSEEQKTEIKADAAAEPKPTTGDTGEDLAAPTEAHEEPIDTVKAPEPEAETPHETAPENTE